jgi:polysaccharide pyruvyl transferase WcaK-like protein
VHCQLNGLDELCKKDNQDDIFIVAGGEITGADVGLMYMHLSKNRFQTVIKKIIRKILKREKFLNYSAKKLKIKNYFPWIIDKEIYGKDIICIYNTIGANSINSVKPEEREYIINQFKKSEYISVRDNKSGELIKNANAKIYPDSATYMSRIFSQEELMEKSSEKIKTFIYENQKRYVCIQMNKGYLINKDKNKVVNEINKIIADGYKVILLPIGFAQLHEDNISLNKIYKKMKKNQNIVYFKKINIYEIMNLIANSIFFAGTSLHGNITAMSFGIRHIGLNKKITKLEEYLKSWEIEGQNECIEIENLYSKFCELLNLNEQEIEENKNRLLELTKENFNNIYNIIKEV